MNLNKLDTLNLVELLWRPETNKKKLFNGDPARNLSQEKYLEYCRSQWHLIAGHGDGQYVALRTAEEMNGLIGRLKSNEPREEIIASLKQGATTDDACENTVNLAARLLLMLKFGVVKGQAIPRRYLRWTEGSLGSFVHDYFDEAPKLNCDHVRLPKAFNAWSIDRIGGIAIDFTNNLADHLLLVEDDSKVLIFPHASFLECQEGPLFPDGLVDETLRTLALLFPQSEFSGLHPRRSDRHKQKWFLSLRGDDEPRNPDARLALCGNLQAEQRQIEGFYFWRDRLVILKLAYDDATPRSLAHWWRDRRDGVQWYNFWVAILVLAITVLLGIIQCIEGVLQIYQAYASSSTSVN